MSDFSESIFSGALPSLLLDTGARSAAGIGHLDAEAARAAAASLAAGAPSPLTSHRRAILEGLALLWHGHWDESHGIAQSHEGEPDHDLLHAILHRREGDFGNSGYWFGMAGKHPCYPGVADRLAGLPPEALRAAGIALERWAPKAFLAAVQKQSARGGEASAALERIQAEEFRAFAAYLLGA